MPDRPVAGTLEDRALPLEVEHGRRLRGLIPYGVESRDLGGWREVIDPAALRGAPWTTWWSTVDHAGVPLGRYPGTLEVEDRADGLHWSVEPAASRADLREAVERGDLRAGSWRMRVARDEWRGDVRHVPEIAELRDVAVVTAPAYPAAAVELRTTPRGGARCPSDAHRRAATARSRAAPPEPRARAQRRTARARRRHPDSAPRPRSSSAPPRQPRRTRSAPRIPRRAGRVPFQRRLRGARVTLTG